MSLIGAGPGDPELLTLKAVKALNSADVILYDQLVAEEIIHALPKRVRKIFVGKHKDNHTISQKNLNQLLIKLACKGLNVCRLKGGDPFIFGRGSEELLALKENQIIAEVIPGVTAASGCSSYAGIPLTHRGVSQGCSFVTGFSAEKDLINWQALAQLGHTLVFYMGLSQCLKIENHLLANGMSADTPVAVIENGCRKNQRVIRSQLDNLNRLPEKFQLKSPALIIIGACVDFAEILNWFDSGTQDTFGDGVLNPIESSARYSSSNTLDASPVKSWARL